MVPCCAIVRLFEPWLRQPRIPWSQIGRPRSNRLALLDEHRPIVS
jgi:hypothetical protein